MSELTVTEPPAAPIQQKQLLTHSRGQSCKTCFKQHYFAYEMRLRPIKIGEPLTEGSAFHDGKEIYDIIAGTHEEKKAAGMAAIAKKYSQQPKWIDSAEAEHKWICSGVKMAVLYSCHCDYWANDEIQVVATEMEYRQPLINPDTGRASRTFDSGGKIDRIVNWGGRLAVQEYKTTSDDIGPDSDYWKRLRIDSQISGYVLGARDSRTPDAPNGYPVETVLYDVTRKPALRPYKATPMESRKYKKDGTLYAAQHETNESPDDYGRRIYEAIQAEPHRYFRREEIARLESDLVEHQHDQWSMQNIIREAQNTGRWPRNTGACKNWYGKCAYFDLCTSGVEVDPLHPPEGFEVLDTAHPELDMTAESLAVAE